MYDRKNSLYLLMGEGPGWGLRTTGNTYVMKTYKYTDSHDSNHRNGFSTRKNIVIHSHTIVIGAKLEDKPFKGGAYASFFRHLAFACFNYLAQKKLYKSKSITDI